MLWIVCDDAPAANNEVIAILAKLGVPHEYHLSRKTCE